MASFNIIMGQMTKISQPKNASSYLPVHHCRYFIYLFLFIYLFMSRHEVHNSMNTHTLQNAGW